MSCCFVMLTLQFNFGAIVLMINGAYRLIDIF